MSSPGRLDRRAWSERERQILDLLAERKTNGEIADALGLSFYTAKWHVSEILSKLGVESRDEAARYWRAESGWRGGMARVAHMLVPPIGLKMAVGVAIAGVGVAGVIAVVGVFAGSAARAPSMRTAATAAVDPCATRVTQCAFGRGIAQDLDANDGRALLGLTKAVQVTCPDLATTSLPGPDVYCRGSEPHIVAYGYATANDMDTRLVSATALASPRPADVPSRNDAYGTGGLRLASIGCPDYGVAVSCDQRFAVAFTWIASCGGTATVPCGRTVRIYIVDRSADGRYLISSKGDYRVADVLATVIKGGSPQLPFGRDIEMTFMPVSK